MSSTTHIRRGDGDYTEWVRTLGGWRKAERRAPPESGGLERFWTRDYYTNVAGRDNPAQ